MCPFRDKSILLQPLLWSRVSMHVDLKHTKELVLYNLYLESAEAVATD